MSTFAAFVAMGGVSYAAVVITGANVRNESLTGADVRNGSIAGTDVTDGSLGLGDISPAARGSMTMDNEGIAWNRLAAVPEGFADGVDNDTDTDTNTTYAAGAGLGLNGTTFAADTTFLQRRVSSNCAAGSSIRSIAQDGTVTCETDDDASLAPGFGLALADGILSVDGDDVTTDAENVAWSRLSMVPAGFADGADADTTYSAGLGVTLTGTTFDLDAAYAQRRVASTCTAGSSIRAIAADGTVTCEADDGVNAGASGVQVFGTTAVIDPNYTQRRVTGTCIHGIVTIAADGTSTCSAAPATPVSASQSIGHDTLFTAGTGATRSAAAFDLAVTTSAWFDIRGIVAYRMTNVHDFENVGCRIGRSGTTASVGWGNSGTFASTTVPVVMYHTLPCGGRVFLAAGTHTISLEATARVDQGVSLLTADLTAIEIA